MNKKLLLVQPWFSAPGHPAHYTLLITRALKSYIPITVLAYVSNDDPAEEWYLRELTETVDVEIVRGRKTGLHSGTWKLYQHLFSLLKRKPEISWILFLDASMYTLTIGLLLRPLFEYHRVMAIELMAPEAHRSNFLKGSIKRLLLQLTTRYRKLRVAFRTPELAASWRQSGLIAPGACLELPTLELANIEAPIKKHAITHRDNLTFVVAGQLFYRKNLERIVPLFRNQLVPGKLLLVGPVQEGMVSGRILTLAAESEHIVFNPQFLSEPELNQFVGKAHYNLMLYVDWDERMESAMLFASIRVGTPIIGRRSGWLERMITEYELGYVIDPYDVDEICTCLSNCALPGSPDYLKFERGIHRMLADHRQEIVVPRFLSTLDIPLPLGGNV
jgi:glycosyltransferase involved in cell wall biosynthesis